MRFCKFSPLSHSAVLMVFLALVFSPLGCSDDPADPAVDDPVGTPTDIHVDQGNVGVVLDTRAIFKKGYTPLTADISFTGYAAFDTTLDVDQTTHYAILTFVAADLEEAILADFEDGTGVQVTINGPSEAILAQHSDDSLVIDNSNTPLILNTSLPFEPQPVMLEEGLAYLIQVHGQSNLFAQSGSIFSFFIDSSYAIADRSQQFFFTPVDGMEGTYEIFTWRVDEMLNLCITEYDGLRLHLDHDHYLPPVQVTLEPNEDGWVRFKDVDTGEYLCLGTTTAQDGQIILLGGGTPMRFRLICDDIDWVVTDRGTVFNQPIMPAAQLDFAYRGELRNCASGELTDSIGTTEERTWEATIGTTEGFELFSRVDKTLGVDVGLTVTASIGADIVGLVSASGSVEVSTNVSYSETYTTSSTTSEERTWSDTAGGSKTVSHTRDYVVPPNTAVLIRDAVKTIRDIRVPFTQVIRVTGTEIVEGRSLTGEEIQSQMMFNFVGGVVKTVGSNYVDVGLRGFTVIDQVFESTTYVDEIENACN